MAGSRRRSAGRTRESYGTGLRFDPYDPRDLLFVAPPRILPVKIDNREEATTVRDQGKEGSCTGQALVAAAELLYWRKLGKPPDLSERWAYERAKEYDEWPGTDYEGSSLRGAVKGWFKEGLCEERYWRYRSGRKGKPLKNAAENAMEYPLLKYERCLGLENMKHAVHHRGMIVVGAAIHEGWFQALGKEMIPFAPENEMVGGHAFAVVGYEDRRAVFWVKNSWGTDWGDEGFAGLAYQDALLNVKDAWSLVVED